MELINTFNRALLLGGFGGLQFFHVRIIPCQRKREQTCEFIETIVKQTTSTIL